MYPKSRDSVIFIHKHKDNVCWPKSTRHIFSNAIAKSETEKRDLKGPGVGDGGRACDKYKWGLGRLYRGVVARPGVVK